jgi:hypothetical protein
VFAELQDNSDRRVHSAGGGSRRGSAVGVELDHHHEFPSAGEVVSLLNLNESQWDRVRADALERDAVGPEGQHGALIDNVMVLRRR